MHWTIGVVERQRYPGNRQLYRSVIRLEISPLLAPGCGASLVFIRGVGARARARPRLEEEEGRKGKSEGVARLLWASPETRPRNLIGFTLKLHWNWSLLASSPLPSRIFSLTTPSTPPGAGRLILFKASKPVISGPRSRFIARCRSIFPSEIQRHEFPATRETIRSILSRPSLGLSVISPRPTIRRGWETFRRPPSIDHVLYVFNLDALTWRNLNRCPINYNRRKVDRRTGEKKKKIENSILLIIGKKLNWWEFGRKVEIFERIQSSDINSSFPIG